MDGPPIKTACVVGAGFSSYAGRPLASDFTESLLEARDYKSGPSRRLTEFASHFVKDVFAHNPRANTTRWPTLEDLFTCIDLSANSGHQLGRSWPPARLRTVRRALIARTMIMLDRRYQRAKDRADDRWQVLREFIRSVRADESAFISLNWDTVVEASFSEMEIATVFDYGCGAIQATAPDERGEVINVSSPMSPPELRIVKMHGSVNWLYCDNCRRLFWFPASDVFQIAKSLLSEEEWRAIGSSARFGRRWMCEACSVALTTRLATFSYLKALDFPMFQSSWHRAEQILADARDWVFIGYSLPPADYEFKYLLKRVELSRRRPPAIVVVAGGKGAKATIESYRQFFGRKITHKEHCIENGLEGLISRT